MWKLQNLDGIHYMELWYVPSRDLIKKGRDDIVEKNIEINPDDATVFSN